jgi:hypothetical protein
VQVGAQSTPALADGARAGGFDEKTMYLGYLRFDCGSASAQRENQF